jgi:tetratricopeptide (TPR) repeat protein
MTTTPDLCPQDALESVLRTLTDSDDVSAIDLLLTSYPSDPRLHFLKGSVLAGARSYEEARRAIGRAVDLAPDYDIARFQLGFLEFTSGEPTAAGGAWEPLLARPADYALRLFAEGLMRLPVDDVAGCVETLRLGIASNSEHPPLNRDMQLLIDELIRQEPVPEEPSSATDQLLRQFDAGPRH